MGGWPPKTDCEFVGVVFDACEGDWADGASVAARASLLGLCCVDKEYYQDFECFSYVVDTS